MGHQRINADKIIAIILLGTLIAHGLEKSRVAFSKRPYKSSELYGLEFYPELEAPFGRTSNLNRRRSERSVEKIESANEVFLVCEVGSE